MAYNEFQAFEHDPENGLVGDCYRTCIAAIIDLPRDAVAAPTIEIYDDAEAFNDFYKRELKRLGLGLISFPLVAIEDSQQEDVIRAIDVWNPGIPCILTGHGARGHNHCVVIQNGKMVYDPHPGQTFITGPCLDSGLYWAEFIVRL